MKSKTIFGALLTERSPLHQGFGLELLDRVAGLKIAVAAANAMPVPRLPAVKK